MILGFHATDLEFSNHWPTQRAGIPALEAVTRRQSVRAELTKLGLKVQMDLFLQYYVSFIISFVALN